MRGFVSGVIWGLLFSALVGATISLVQGRVDRDKAEMGKDDAAAVVSQTPESESQAAMGGEDQATGETDAAAQADTPAADGAEENGAVIGTEQGSNEQPGATGSDSTSADDGAAQQTDTPDAAPEPAQPETDPAPDPAQQPDNGTGDNPSETPVPAVPDNSNDSGALADPFAGVESAANTPSQNADETVAEQTEQPATPPAAAVDTAELPKPQTGENDMPKMAAAESESSTAQMATVQQPKSPTGDDAPMIDTAPVATPEVNAQIAGGQSNPPLSENDTAQAAMNTPEARVDTPPSPKLPEAPETTQPPQIEVTQNTPEPETPLRVPVPKIRSLAPNVETNRLPTIGGDTAEAKTENAGVASPAEDENGTSGDKPALSAYAVPFTNPDAKPLFSIILIDDPDYPLSDKALSRLPFALSFAIDAGRDDAAELAARYRQAGFEVLMLTNLPKGAGASDVEVAFESYARTMPESVAVLDRDADAKVARQLAGILSERGMGLVTPSKGLNSAQKAAKREGVPAALVYRQIDEEDENPSVIRRYLDRAAFRAAQEGQVIMLGRTRPETIEALVLWALEDRAASVAIAPVSAVLKGL